MNESWKPLNDVQWMNIVNHDRAYDQWSKDDAVHHAVKMTEAKLKEINAAPAIPAATAQQPVEPEFCTGNCYGGDVIRVMPGEEYFAATAQGWISVKDRLPGGDIGVLITDGVKISSACWVSANTNYPYWTGCGFSGWEWDFDFDPQSVTHWQLLPPPPVGDSDG